MDNNGSRDRRKPRGSRMSVAYDNGSLIPSEIIDQASQRIFIVSLFILLQSWKVYDVVMINSRDFAGAQVTGLNNFTFVLKYAVLDGAFLWLLPILNIQYLTFSPLKTLLLTLTMNIISFFIVSETAVPFLSSAFLPIWKSIASKRELTIVGESVNTKSVVDIDAHFKGKYTIHYLPDSSARFNPFHFDTLCLDQDKKKPIYMPIEFNSTNDLGSLHIQHITPANEVRVQRYEKKDLQKLLRRDYAHLKKHNSYISTDERVFYIEVPIAEPGLYRIKQVTDIKGGNIRTYKSDFKLSSCPSVSFSYPSTLDFNKNFMCQGEDPNISLPLIKSSGIYPLTVEFLVLFGKRNFHTFNSTIDIDQDSSNDELSRLQPRVTTRNILEQVLSEHLTLFQSAPTGSTSFQIVKVTDFLGNKLRYNPSSNNKDVHYSVDVKPIPIISMHDSNPERELVVNGSKWLKFSMHEGGNEALPVTVQVGYESLVDKTLSYNFSRTFSSARELAQGIEIESEGRYRLLEFQGHYCKGKIASVVPVEVKLANPPSVSINANPIVEKCIGMTGFNFEYKFQGKAPFEVHYNVYQNMSNRIMKPLMNERGVVTRSIRSLVDNYKFEYKPPSEGNYVIVFNSITDSNYKVPLPLDKRAHTYSTHFNQRSKISVSGGSNRHVFELCYDESISLDLDLKGNLPFSFQYDIINRDTRQKLVDTTKVSDAFDCTIQSPPFVKGGIYELKLSSIKDSLYCDVDFEDEILIKARSDVPQLSIDSKEKHFLIVEGDTLQIPLKSKATLDFSSNDRLTYTLFDLVSNRPIAKRDVKNFKSLGVKEAGKYVLSGFTNRGCEGVITEENNVVSVSYHPRPNLTVVESDNLKQHKSQELMHLTPFCQNSDRKIELSLEGEGPFVVDFDIKFPNGNIETKSIKVNGNSASVRVPSSKSGSYEIIFKGVYDSLYTKDKVELLSNMIPKTIRYDVRALPNAYFDKNKRYTQICETDLDSTKGIEIPLNLVGAYPFNLNMTLLNEQSGQKKRFSMQNVDKSSLTFRVDEHKLEIGQHMLRVDGVEDYNGCSRSLPESANNYVISVTRVPGIEHLDNKNFYCVGEHVNYNLSGIPPFTVYYDFNGKLQKAESSNTFQRLASKPGFLSIVALSDSSANKCLVNVTQNVVKYEDLQIEVYDLPSVEINQGDYIVQDIHEGDQTEMVFTFKGTPPFSLTYIRTVEGISQGKSKSASKTIERMTKSDIMEYSYSTMVSLEGTYEAVEVSDAYCTAKRDTY